MENVEAFFNDIASLLGSDCAGDFITFLISLKAYQRVAKWEIIELPGCTREKFFC